MKGLSLVEMLIAISLFALLALLGSSLLNTSVSSNLSIQEKNDRLDKLVLLNKYLRQDFTQSVNTIPRDEMGAYELSTMELNSSDSDEILLRLIKLSDTDGLEDTGALRKIIYKLDSGELIRESYRYIDNEEPFQTETLLDEVDYVDLEIFFENVSYEAWPVSEEIFFDSSLPEAVEVKIGFYDLSIFNKILLVNYG